MECTLGVIVQYSLNNGVQWEFLRELEFGSFLEPQLVTIELPSQAKTPYTVFRWWQPEQGKKFGHFLCIGGALTVNIYFLLHLYT